MPNPHSSSKQRERRQRGEDFQNEIRAGWRQVANIWRLRISDGVGGTRPADELVSTLGGVLLIELKRTEGMKFELNMLRTSQLKGLRDFDEVLENHCGMVIVSFHNPEQGRDETYAFRLRSVVQWMRHYGVEYVHLEDFRKWAVPNQVWRVRANHSSLLRCLSIPRKEDGTYDLSEVPRNCKDL